METLRELFDKYHEDEFLHTERLPSSVRSFDLYAMNLLEEIVHTGGSIISGVCGERIYFNTCTNKLSKTATEHQIITLIRCGVMLDKSNDVLCIFA
jgi:hypothetical protein